MQGLFISFLAKTADIFPYFTNGSQLAAQIGTAPKTPRQKKLPQKQRGRCCRTCRAVYAVSFEKPRIRGGSCPPLIFALQQLVRQFQEEFCYIFYTYSKQFFFAFLHKLMVSVATCHNSKEFFTLWRLHWKHT